MQAIPQNLMQPESTETNRSAMIFDVQIREVCARVAAETDLDELEHLLIGLRMLAAQFLRERSIARSNPAQGNSNGNKHAA
jgi:hypothetical protein